MLKQVRHDQFHLELGISGRQIKATERHRKIFIISVQFCGFLKFIVRIFILGHLIPLFVPLHPFQFGIIFQVKFRSGIRTIRPDYDLLLCFNNFKPLCQ